MGLAPLTLFTTILLIVRNQRILDAWNARQQENARRAAPGLPPKTRKRRRKTLAGLAAPPAALAQPHGQARGHTRHHHHRQTRQPPGTSRTRTKSPREHQPRTERQ